MGRTVWREKKMKKAVWVISFIPLILTAAALQFMPDLVPAHYDFSGKISYVFVGVLLIIIANIIPKSRRNHSVGVRISWSLYKKKVAVLYRVQ